MDDTEPQPWTIDQHLATGSTAINQISTVCMHVDPEPICHYFDEANPVDPMKVSVEATYRHLVPQFASAGVMFLPDRLEAWETVTPRQEWLQRRVPAMLEAAKAAGLVYRGWTWEPRNRHPIGASDLHVINNRTS